MTKLVMDARNDYTWYVMWVVDGEEGAAVGQDGTMGEQALVKQLEDARAKPNDEDDMCGYAAVELAAKKYAEINDTAEFDKSHEHWVFGSRAACARFLSAMNAARQAEKAVAEGRPLPEWAQTARAAGWKAPKGWKP